MRSIAFLLCCLAAGCDAPAAAQTPAPKPPMSMPADDGMDSRTPLPLLPMMAVHQKEQMREHLAAVQQIVAALAQNDFARIVEAANKIGYSDAEAMECKHMGAAAPGFLEVALKFHRTADKIAEAARKKDRKGVTAALGATLEQCVGCHGVYRQKIVDEATWTRLSGMAPPMGGMHHH